MNFSPYQYSTHHTGYSKDVVPKVTDPSLSIDGTQIKKSLATDSKEISGNDVQSFVIVNDIDVEEELNKAQKENANFFKVLSMSFYGKGKSHSVDHQDSRESHKPPGNNNNGLTALLPRKASAQTPLTNTNIVVKDVLKQNQNLPPPTSIKRQRPPISNIELQADNLRKQLASPKNDTLKVYSPMVKAKKPLIGNFSGKIQPKKESIFCTQSLQKTPNVPLSEEIKQPASAYLKTQTGRSNSPKCMIKKTGSFKLAREQAKFFDKAQERTQLAEPSNLDIKLQDLYEKERDRDRSYDTTGKDSKGTSKQGSRRGSSGKLIKEKGSSTPNNSGRSIPSTSNGFSSKGLLKESLEIKVPFFDQTIKTNLMTMSGTGSNAATRKYSSYKSENKKQQKANSQGAKVGTQSGDKFRPWNLFDMQDSGDEEENRMDTLGQQQRSYIARGTKKNNSCKLDRQKSPVLMKFNERMPVTMAPGIGTWGISDVLMSRESPMLKLVKKHSESAKLKKTSTGKEGQKKKMSSAEKMAKAKLYMQLKDGRRTAVPEPKDNCALRLDLTKCKDEKIYQILETIEKRKETRLKTRPMSPVFSENRGSHDMFEKPTAATRKKNSKDKLFG